MSNQSASSGKDSIVSKGLDGSYIIDIGNGLAYYQRSASMSASDTPLSDREEIIHTLCRHILGE